MTPKTAVLFVSFSADLDGSAYSPPEVVQRIVWAANAPVFGLFDAIMGNKGIFGGIIPSHSREAVRIVELVLEILRGNLPTLTVTITSTPRFPIFDWEQLKRWDMNGSKLLLGSMVLNRP